MAWLAPGRPMFKSLRNKKGTSAWPYCNNILSFYIFDPYIFFNLRICIYIYTHLFFLIIYRVTWDVLGMLNWSFWGDEQHPFTPLRGRTAKHIFLNKRTSKCQTCSFWNMTTRNLLLPQNSNVVTTKNVEGVRVPTWGGDVIIEFRRQ